MSSGNPENPQPQEEPTTSGTPSDEAAEPTRPPQPPAYTLGGSSVRGARPQTAHDDAPQQPQQAPPQPQFSPAAQPPSSPAGENRPADSSRPETAPRGEQHRAENSSADPLHRDPEQAEAEAQADAQAQHPTPQVGPQTGPNIQRQHSQSPMPQRPGFAPGSTEPHSGAEAPTTRQPSVPGNVGAGTAAAGAAGGAAAGSAAAAHGPHGAEQPTMRHDAVPQPAPAGGPGAPGNAGGPGSYPGSAQARSQQAPRKSSKMPLIITAIAVGLVVLLIAIGAIIVGVVNRSNHGPDKLAQDYIDKLSSGDMDGASSIAQPSVPEGSNEGLLDPKYVEASQDKISDAQVKDTQIDGDNAVVKTTYTLAGQQHSLDLKAHKDGKEGLFFDKWALDGPALQTIAVTAPKGSGSTINGKDFSNVGGTTSYAVYPGSYELSTPGSKYIEKATDETTVGFGGGDAQSATLTSRAKATKAFSDDVDKAVKDKIKACEKTEEKAPKGCPMSVGEGSSSGVSVKDDMVDKTVQWKVSVPKVTAALDPNGSGGSFSSLSAMTYSFKADSKKMGKNKWMGSGSRHIGGTVEIDGDKLKIKEFFGANK